jgi:hypothetical protein
MERLQHFGGDCVVAAERFNFDRIGARPALEEQPWNGLGSWRIPPVRIPPIEPASLLNLVWLALRGRTGYRFR